MDCDYEVGGSYTVSGRVTRSDSPTRGIEGVILAFSAGYGTATTDGDGRWIKNGLEGQVRVSPAKGGWVFEPPSRNVSRSDDAVDFTGRPSSHGTYGVLQAAGGGYHTVALRADGTVWAWGDNEHGQLGNGTKTNSLRPVQVVGLDQVTEVAAGRYHSLALKADGTVWAWGANSQGQLGNGYYSDRSAPVQVSILSTQSIAAGDYHSLALCSGVVLSWGDNGYGQLGNGGYLDSSWPVYVGGSMPTDIRRIAAGGLHSLAAAADGTVWAWGHNGYGQLGDGTTTNGREPVQAVGIEGVTEVAAGDSHSVAIGSCMSLWTWGSNNAGQLGNGTTTDELRPIQIEGFFLNTVAVAAGEAHSMALKFDGTVWAWGRNDSGQLGNGTGVRSLTPVQAFDLRGVESIDVGGWHSTAVKDDATLWVWGANWSGQLGDGTDWSRSIPTQVQPF